MILISIRQPGYFPYMGLFKKIQTSDVFVFFDDAQYAIRAWDNRNKILKNNFAAWLTVPVIKPFKKLLNEVKIDTENWNIQHIELIKNSYEKSPYFHDYWNDIESILLKKWEKLVDLNIVLIEHFMKILEISTKTVKSSELGTTGNSSQKLLNICKKLNSDRYLSGPMGKEYLDERLFHNAGVKVIYENFVHPKYSQISQNFVPNLSIIDLLFNEGDNAKSIIKNSKNI
jgi:hypothetical protein